MDTSREDRIGESSLTQEIQFTKVKRIQSRRIQSQKNYMNELESMYPEARDELDTELPKPLVDKMEITVFVIQITLTIKFQEVQLLEL